MSTNISDKLYERVKHSIPAKKISCFVAEAISKELTAKEQSLEVAYISVQQDEDSQLELQSLDDINCQ